MSTAAVRRYWTTIAAMGCIVTGGPAEICHAHGGSLLIRGRELGRDYTKAKGVKLAHMDWLVLPLAPLVHRIAPYSLDQNVAEFEERFGPQTYWLDEMVRRTGVDIWALAVGRHERIVA